MPNTHPVPIGTPPVPIALPEVLAAAPASNLWSETPALPSAMQQTAYIITRSPSGSQDFNQPMPRVESEVSIGPLLAGITMMVIMRRHR
ncbi:MAG: hypothetical protein MUF13_00810 [Akkermansiaceae bacterium]|nr:hypothetical protein [Akkermansiaceae bacterium]